MLDARKTMVTSAVGVVKDAIKAMEQEKDGQRARSPGDASPELTPPD
jgi:hypothetical protein